MNTLSGLSRNVSALLAVLIASIAIVGIDWLIAAKDDHWGDTGLVLYNLIGVAGIAAILLSLGLLVRSRKPVRP